jgi:H+/Cl- antiporter ClcA
VTTRAAPTKTPPVAPSPPPQSPAGGSSSDSVFVPLTKSPGFWKIIGSAALFGIALSFGALAFLGLLKGGGKWFTLPKNPGWFDGKLWWVAVTVGAGALVGVLRHVLRVPAKIPGTVAEIKDPLGVKLATILPYIAVSLVSLAGGASLGPEGALGKMGGGLGTWVSERQKDSDDVRATNALSGMSAAYGGLLASPIMATILIVEVATLSARRFAETLVACLLSSTIAFGIYYAIAGETFVGLFRVPSYAYKDWHLLAAIPLGLAAAALGLITIIVIGVMKKLTARLAKQTILCATIGGLIFGLVAVALPLTLFTGTDQLSKVIDHGAILGAGLLIAVVFGKMLVFAVCESTGFLGGPFLVMLFIGGTAGTAAHVLIPGLPEGLAFTTMFAALPGALVGAPFSLILLAALTTQVGALEVAPIAIAVVTAYLAVSGSGLLMALISRASKPAGPSTQPARS